MKKSDFYFDLPKTLIAQTPLVNRAASRLMVVDKENGQTEHKNFYDLLSYLEPNDCLVLNETKVLPARIFGYKDTGAKVEFLLLRRLEGNRWETLVKPGKKAKIGSRFSFGKSGATALVIDSTSSGGRIVEFEYEGIFEEFLEKEGQMPLPPYITETLEDQSRYQTVYGEKTGSAAAPTAGLHFTETLLKQIEKKGVKICKVTLHVGLGTFRPVKADNILDHEMHAEYYEMSAETAKTINEVREKKGRIIAVGTTSTRVLETIGNEKGLVCSQSGWTDIFIYPGYKFKMVDGLVTNFHLPESTLIMLVSAFSKREWVLNAYKEAVDEKYRFFSFGDAMLIV